MTEKDINFGGFFELATASKIYVNGVKLHGIEKEILLHYTGVFKIIGSLLIGEIEQKSNIRFGNVHDFETYNIAIDVVYESEDVILTRWLHKLNKPQFNKVNSSHYGKVTDYNQAIAEYTGNICYFGTSGNCLIKCITYLTCRVYTPEVFGFIRGEKRINNVMTSGTIQPFCKKHNINIDCFDGSRTNPRKITERNEALYLYENQFCLIWKLNGISFKKATEELKLNFKVGDIVVSDKLVKNFIKIEQKP